MNARAVAAVAVERACIGQNHATAGDDNAVEHVEPRRAVADRAAESGRDAVSVVGVRRAPGDRAAADGQDAVAGVVVRRAVADRAAGVDRDAIAGVLVRRAAGDHAAGADRDAIAGVVAGADIDDGGVVRREGSKVDSLVPPGANRAVADGDVGEVQDRGRDAVERAHRRRAEKVKAHKIDGHAVGGDFDAVLANRAGDVVGEVVGAALGDLEKRVGIAGGVSEVDGDTRFERRDLVKDFLYCFACRSNWSGGWGQRACQRAERERGYNECGQHGAVVSYHIAKCTKIDIFCKGKRATI